MRVGPVLAMMMALGAAGCTDVVPLVPLNAQAQAVGTPQLHYAVGLPAGVMKVVMPNGEVLPGTFRIDEAVTGGSGDGNFHASASGPRSSLACLGRVSAGHGTAECRAQDGALYQVQL